MHYVIERRFGKKLFEQSDSQFFHVYVCIKIMYLLQIQYLKSQNPYVEFIEGQGKKNACVSNVLHIQINKTFL